MSMGARGEANPPGVGRLELSESMGILAKTVETSIFDAFDAHCQRKRM